MTCAKAPAERAEANIKIFFIMYTISTKKGCRNIFPPNIKLFASIDSFRNLFFTNFPKKTKKSDQQHLIARLLSKNNDLFF